MCIICVKNAGIEMPSAETIRIMWQNNPDGAGFMYVMNNSVHIEKGFMTLEEFNAAIENLQCKVNLKTIPVIMHFRITTHGGTKPSNCHPFPVTENIGVLQKLKSTAEWGVAHNGILSVTPRTGISDTMEYIATQLAVMKKINHRFAENKYFLELIANATVGSRLALMNNRGEIFLTGNWVDDNETGLKYSNSNYKYSFYKSYKYDNTWHSAYDWDDYYSTSSNFKINRISVCDAEDVGAHIFVDGKEVDYMEYPMWYVDKNGKTYWYSDPDEGIVLEDKRTTVKFDDDKHKFDWYKSILMDVIDEPTTYDFVCDYCGHLIEGDVYETVEGELLCDDCRQMLGVACTKIG